MNWIIVLIMLHSSSPDDSGFQAQREYMVRTQIEARGVSDTLVLSAMRAVPRHRFMRESERRNAYDDSPYSIGFGQTISQPYIVAFMTELIRPGPSHKVLDIGTGSGYQTAVLAEIVDSVYTIEIICELQERADSILREQGYENIHTRCGDGYFGWPEAAPFDGIIVGAAPEKVPQPLLDQLKEGGRLVIPVGDAYQYLEVYTKEGGKVRRDVSIPVRFVPMTGEAEKDDE